MKLLLDHNLSHKLCRQLDNVFSDILQVRMAGLERASDLEIWEYALSKEFTIVTHDADFYDLSLLRGHPPKVIWLRCGNQPTANIGLLLRKHVQAIADFCDDPVIACLELY